MHHTILPMEALEQQQPIPQAVCLSCRYGFVAGAKDQEGRFVIQQLISTDPAAYLDPSFAPGQFFTEEIPPGATC